MFFLYCLERPNKKTNNIYSLWQCHWLHVCVSALLHKVRNTWRDTKWYRKIIIQISCTFSFHKSHIWIVLGFTPRTGHFPLRGFLVLANQIRSEVAMSLDPRYAMMCYICYAVLCCIMPWEESHAQGQGHASPRSTKFLSQCLRVLIGVSNDQRAQSWSFFRSKVEFDLWNTVLTRWALSMHWYYYRSLPTLYWGCRQIGDSSGLAIQKWALGDAPRFQNCN